MQTFDGVDVMGKRLADEVLKVVDCYPDLEKISFVGHSLGGLIARYAVAKLYKKTTTEENHEKGIIFIEEEEAKGTIAGLEPVNFITVATPHLGCRGHKQAPAFCGSYAMEKAAAGVSGILGRSGKHLFLNDGRRHGLPPLLIRMTKDSDDLPFISSLQSFRRRVAYANTRFDFVVGWSTSSLRLQHELPKRRSMIRNENYPHILETTDSIQTVDYQDKTTSSPTTLVQVKRSKTANMEEEMMKGLSKLRWERVDVDFGRSTQRIMAHNTIQVQIYSLQSDGADVIQHMIDNFML
ncbi:lipid droplet phospholipase 1-like [Impatiens glandulifera]|uniref:lipid droplet phospholipase 1-like n=1 Tax=Impatiens glandulifera TaxID=253017 RepID=UPI001FB17143|nr:lipid droplet phospholipase 1-like [Impatiens glandulifera]